jgi:hypothetical protein
MGQASAAAGAAASSNRPKETIREMDFLPPVRGVSRGADQGRAALPVPGPRRPFHGLSEDKVFQIVTGTVEIRYLSVKAVYETQSLRCQNSDTRLYNQPGSTESRNRYLQGQTM